MSNGHRETLERQRLWAGVVMSIGLLVMVLGVVTDAMAVIVTGGAVGILATIAFVALSWALERRP